MAEQVKLNNNHIYAPLCIEIIIKIIGFLAFVPSVNESVKRFLNNSVPFVDTALLAPMEG